MRRVISQKPSVGELLALPSVIAGIRLAYADSDVGGSRPREQGGFLVQDFLSGFITVIRLPASARDSLSFPLCSNGMYEGQRIVGSFHTHPNTGTEWRQEPSPQDILLSREYPDTMGPHQFIISCEMFYHVSHDGLVTEVGRTAEVLKLDTEEPNL